MSKIDEEEAVRGVEAEAALAFHRRAVEAADSAEALVVVASAAL